MSAQIIISIVLIALGVFVMSRAYYTTNNTLKRVDISGGSAILLIALGVLYGPLIFQG